MQQARSGPESQLRRTTVSWSGIPWIARANHPQTPENIAGIAGNIAAGRLRTWQKHGEADGYARNPPLLCPLLSAV
jgi:hypothetical protein